MITNSVESSSREERYSSTLHGQRARHSSLGCKVAKTDRASQTSTRTSTRSCVVGVSVGRLRVVSLLRFRSHHRSQRIRSLLSLLLLDRCLDTLDPIRHRAERLNGLRIPAWAEDGEVDIHLDGRSLDELLYCDGRRRRQDVVEDPVQAEPGRCIHCKPAKHEWQKPQHEASVLAGLIAGLFEGIERAKQVEGSRLRAHEDRRKREVAQRVVPAKCWRAIHPALSQPADALRAVGNRSGEVGEPEEALLIDLCLCDRRDGVVYAQEDGDLEKGRQAAGERVDLILLKQRCSLNVK
mmetsp:Transcript_45604/g.119786  ORF Transcript_45604/g.119786 Transcript_45604/m.119786 type:complete len:295 (-) Transcript_45604:513-1397(-)